MLTVYAFGNVPAPVVGETRDLRVLESSAIVLYLAEKSDLDGLIALSKADAILSMPPFREWFVGREAIRGFFAYAWTTRGYAGFRLLPTRANGQPAFALYSRTHDSAEFRAPGINQGAKGPVAIDSQFRGPLGYRGRVLDDGATSYPLIRLHGTPHTVESRRGDATCSRRGCRMLDKWRERTW